MLINILQYVLLYIGDRVTTLHCKILLFDSTNAELFILNRRAISTLTVNCSDGDVMV